MDLVNFKASVERPARDKQPLRRFVASVSLLLHWACLALACAVLVAAPFFVPTSFASLSREAVFFSIGAEALMVSSTIAGIVAMTTCCRDQASLLLPVTTVLAAMLALITL